MGNAVRPISYSYSDQNSQASFYQNSLWISPNSFQSDIIHSYSQPVTADTYYEMQMIDLPLANEGSSIRPKEQILEEIVRECEEIERRSSPSSHGGSSPISIYSSSDRDTPDSLTTRKMPEKRERKKAQNRLAATRYREKKRKEKEVKMDQIMDLQNKNIELKRQAESLESEIKYLKKLMKEVGIQ